VQFDSIAWTQTAPDTAQQNSSQIATHAASLGSYSGLFLEPGLIMRIGYQHIKLETALWWSQPIKQDPPFLWANSNVSIGLSVDLSP
jgi:hypothetical protein